MPRCRTRFALLSVLASVSLAAAAPASLEARSAAAQRVTELADLYYQRILARYPDAPHLLDHVSRHDGLTDNSPGAHARHEREDDAMLAALLAVGTDTLAGQPEWVTLGTLIEALEAAEGLRVCELALWNVNHMSGWQLLYPRVAERQPVDSPALREQALTRWRKFPAFVDQEIVNLERGLARGYSAPKSVVGLVLEQVDGLLALTAAETPFMSPAVRADDPGFTAAFERIVDAGILPAIARYRAFLADAYLDKAREALAVSANPDGRACYAASLRSYTTLKRAPEDVYALGRRTVETNRARVIELGRARYDETDFAAIMAAVAADPANRFESRDDVLAFSRAAVNRAEQSLEAWFGRLPARGVVVEPYPDYQDGTGVSSRYEPGAADHPGVYRITLHAPTSQRRDNAEITAVHEAYPGHHLQIAIADELEGAHPIARVLFNSGFVEGWARYAEALGEEMGLYDTATAPIARRAWPARGMVVDPGIHLLGWSREQATAFIAEAERMPPEQAATAPDRIAILPGQLTAYDSGGLEIFALRRQAEAALGERFDIRAFHDRVLEHGAVPLWLLRRHVESWIGRERASARADAGRDSDS